MWRKLVDRLSGYRRARRAAESDAPAEMGTPVSRQTGGGSAVGTEDAHSTTGTTSSGTFVGRVGGDEAGDVGEGAGEMSSEQTFDGKGAARDE
jgi:hypothetical protein